MSRVPGHIEEFLELKGEEFIGEWRQVSSDRERDFFRGTYMDLSYGNSVGDGYPEGMIEGFQQVGLLDWLSSELIGRWYGFNYGLDRVRFVTPLTIHDEFRLRLVVADAERRNDGVLVTYDSQLEKRSGDKPSMVARWLVLLLPEPVSS